LVTDIAHELGGERNGARAVIDDGDFELADLAAIEARRLPAGERRGGLRGGANGASAPAAAVATAAATMRRRVNSVMASSGKQRLAPTSWRGGGRADATPSRGKTERRPQTGQGPIGHGSPAPRPALTTGEAHNNYLVLTLLSGLKSGASSCASMKHCGPRPRAAR